MNIDVDCKEFGLILKNIFERIDFKFNIHNFIDYSIPHKIRKNIESISTLSNIFIFSQISSFLTANELYSFMNCIFIFPEFDFHDNFYKNSKKKSSKKNKMKLSIIMKFH